MLWRQGGAFKRCATCSANPRDRCFRAAARYPGTGGRVEAAFKPCRHREALRVHVCVRGVLSGTWSPPPRTPTHSTPRWSRTSGCDRGHSSAADRTATKLGPRASACDGWHMTDAPAICTASPAGAKACTPLFSWARFPRGVRLVVVQVHWCSGAPAVRVNTPRV
jgi:hypothetical protein